MPAARPAGPASTRTPTSRAVANSASACARGQAVRGARRTAAPPVSGFGAAGAGRVLAWVTPELCVPYGVFASFTRLGGCGFPTWRAVHRPGPPCYQAALSRYATSSSTSVRLQNANRTKGAPASGGRRRPRSGWRRGPALRERAAEGEAVGLAERPDVGGDEEYVTGWKPLNPASVSPAASTSRLASMSARNAAKYVSGSASASATAYWNGPDATYVRNCWADRTAVTRSAVTQPTFHPVKEKVFPALPMVTVRCRIREGGQRQVLRPRRTPGARTPRP